MRRGPLALLVLFALALRLGAGPHPCHAMSASARPAAPVHASCHGTRAPVPKGGDDCCDPRTGDHSLCEKGCERAAVLRVALALPVARSFDEPAVPAADRPAPAVVFPIDHVPLA